MSEKMVDPFEAVETLPLDQEVIGMTKDEAIAKIKEANHKVRVVAEDGEDFFVTMDYWPDRLNLKIVAGKVVEVSRG